MNFMLKRLGSLTLAAALTTSLSVSAITINLRDFINRDFNVDSIQLEIDANKDTVDTIRTKFAEKAGVSIATVVLYDVINGTKREYDPRYPKILNYSKSLVDNYELSEQSQIKEGKLIYFYIAKNKDGAIDISDLEVIIRSTASNKAQHRIATAVKAQLEIQLKAAASSSSNSSSSSSSDEKKDEKKNDGNNS